MLQIYSKALLPDSVAEHQLPTSHLPHEEITADQAEYVKRNYCCELERALAEKQWSELISSRRAFYEERHVGTEFRLWPEEEAFVQAQAARRADGLEPEAIPGELQNWQERAEDEVRRLIEEQKRELLAKWKDAALRWENYLAERQAYQDEFYSGRKYELSSEEQQFVQQQKLRRKHELKPEIPEWLDNWRQKADALRQREYEAEAQWKWKWKNFDKVWRVYRSGRKKF